MFAALKYLQTKQSNFGFQQMAPNDDISLYMTTPGIISYMRPANERRRYNVTSSLIDWAHRQNDSAKFVEQKVELLMIHDPHIMGKYAGKPWLHSISKRKKTNMDGF